MTTLTVSNTTTIPKQIRPFNIRKDLLPVADLIELCFAHTLDSEGIRYIRQLRAAARSVPTFLSRLYTTSRYSIPIKGYVWEENGEIVGNLSLIPFTSRRRAIYLIANVAVHPDHRQRGIASQLTKTALEKLRSANIRTVWLQARDDNQVAIDLYTKVGFEPVSLRTQWVVKPRQITIPLKDITGKKEHQQQISSRVPQHWQKQIRWLDANYPLELRWQLQLNPNELKPGIMGSLNRFLNDLKVLQWSVLDNDELIGVVSWQSSFSTADRIWLAADEYSEKAVLEKVLPKMISMRPFTKPMMLNYPADRAVDTLSSLGFHAQHTLLWMKMAL